MGQQEMPTASEKQLVALGRILQTLREEENADVLIETTLNYLQTEFEYNLIWIGLYDRLDHRLFGKGGITPTGDTTLLHQRFFLNPGDLLEQVVIQQRPVGIPDLREEVRAGEWRRAAQQFGVQGTLLFPLRYKDRCFGVALLGSHFWGVSTSAASRAQLSLLFGGLAQALYQIEADWQRSSSKRPDQALFGAIDQVTAQTTIEQRLQAVVAATQQFVTPTRTSLYWFEPQGRYFWHRSGNQQKPRAIANLQAGSSGLLVQEVNDFYLALVAGQTVAIGAGKSPLKAEVTGRLMQRLRARSMLAAPVIVRDSLVGFLAVEGSEARIWEEAEKNYVRATAGLVAIIAESEEATSLLAQSLSSTQSLGRVASFVADNTDNPTKALKQCAKALLKHLGVERFLWLEPETSGKWTIVYQHVSVPNRRAIPAPLPALPDFARGPSAQDKGEMTDEPGQSTKYKPVAIEDWEEDEKLLAWKSCMIQVGVRSLLACPTSYVQNQGLLVLCHGTPRTWKRTEQDLVSIVSQQIGMLAQFIEARDLNSSATEATEKQRVALKAFLSFPEEITAFDRAFLTFLANELSCPSAVLLSCAPDNPIYKVDTAVTTSPSFALPPNLAIYANQDILIREVLTADGLLERRIKDLPKATRAWFSSTDIGCLLVMALPSKSFESGALSVELEQKNTESFSSSTQNSRAIDAIVLLADGAQRQWPKHLLPVTETLVRQFALFRHYLRSHDAQESAVRDLEQLNWYKHQCLEIFYQTVAASVSALTELQKDDTQEQPNNLKSAFLNSRPGMSSNPKLPDTLRRMRSSQLLHQLENTLTNLPPVLNEEQWQSTLTLTQIPIANLLKRSLVLIKPLTLQRQISLNSHISTTDRIYGDRLKLECVLFEVLLSAINFTRPKGKIDLWCRPRSAQSNELEAMSVELKEKSDTRSSSDSSTQHSSSVELLIADKVAFEIMNARGKKSDEYPIHSPTELPNLNLKICQRVLRSWGGDLQFYQLENCPSFVVFCPVSG